MIESGRQTFMPVQTLDLHRVVGRINQVLSQFTHISQNKEVIYLFLLFSKIKINKDLWKLLWPVIEGPHGIF
jgi:hypothetical protein